MIQRLTYQSAGAADVATYERDPNGELRIRCPNSRGSSTSFLVLMIAGNGITFSALLACLFYVVGEAAGARKCGVAVLVFLSIGIASYIVWRLATPRYDVIIVSDDGIRFEQWSHRLEKEAHLGWPDAEFISASDLLFSAIRVGVEPRWILVEWHGSPRGRSEAVERLRADIAERRHQPAGDRFADSV